jgi:hypothetical protein
VQGASWEVVLMLIVPGCRAMRVMSLMVRGKYGRGLPRIAAAKAERHGHSGNALQGQPRKQQPN